MSRHRHRRRAPQTQPHQKVVTRALTAGGLVAVLGVGAGLWASSGDDGTPAGSASQQVADGPSAGDRGVARAPSP
ncbi:hypothetical protein PV723_19805, partial [Streptomyces sp. AK04-3B]|nr:hypothetical protein [Streptomyces sp. AK04-3B]